MSHIRNKTKVVLRQGRESRETWSPVLGSTPLRHYLWWREQTGKVRQQENFCHFWRVVLIWAPLLRLRKLSLDRSAVVWLRRNVGVGGVVFVGCLLYVAALLVSASVAMSRLLWATFGAWAIALGPLSVVGVVAALIGCTIAFGYTCKGIGWLYQRLMHSGEWTDEPVKPIVPRRLRELSVPRPELPQTVRRAHRKAGRFGRSVGEYMVLVLQVIRVKKWKICPLVHIPETVSLEK